MSIRIPGLKPATTYNYRVAATNNSGTTTGQHGEFTTEPLKPEPGKRDRRRPRRPRPLQAPRPALAAAPRVRAPSFPVGVKFDTRRGLARAHEREPQGRYADRHGSAAASCRCASRGAPTAASTSTCAAATSAPAGRVRLHRGRASGSALASASRKRRVRRLWGNDSGGRYRTHGRHSHATVRGTQLADHRPLRRHAHDRPGGRRRGARPRPPPQRPRLAPDTATSLASAPTARAGCD